VSQQPVRPGGRKWCPIVEGQEAASERDAGEDEPGLVGQPACPSAREHPEAERGRRQPHDTDDLGRIALESSLRRDRAETPARCSAGTEREPGQPGARRHYSFALKMPASLSRTLVCGNCASQQWPPSLSPSLAEATARGSLVGRFKGRSAAGWSGPG